MRVKSRAMSAGKILAIVRALKDKTNRTFQAVAKKVLEETGEYCTTEDVRQINDSNRIRVHHPKRNQAMILRE